MWGAVGHAQWILIFYMRNSIHICFTLFDINITLVKGWVFAGIVVGSVDGDGATVVHTN